MKLPKIKHNSNFPFIHLRPMLFAALGFVLGILSVFQIVIYQNFSVLIIFSLLISLLFSGSLYQILRKKTKILLFCTAIIFIFGLCGGFVSYMQVSAYEREELQSGYYTVYGTIKEESELEDGYSLLLSDLTFKSHEETFSSAYQMSLIVFDKREDISVGKRIKTYARVTVQEKDEYYSYQMANGIKFVAFVGDSAVTVVGETKNFFDKIRLKGISVLEKHLSRDALSLSTGMLFGETSKMREDTLIQFRKLGIAHIFAVSGLHIGFLCLIITKLLRRTEARNPVRFLVPTIAVFFYAGICGFTPSAMRAAIMCATSLLFTCIGAPYDPFSGVLFSAIVVLAVNPIDVLSYGFILSYVCVLSILIVSPMLKRLFYRLPAKIGDTLAISIGIQVGVFPVQMLLFGYAAPISVLLNLIFIPIITPLYILLLIFTVSATILPVLGFVFVYFEEILSALLWVLGKIPSRFIIDGINVRGGVVAYYFGVILSSYHVNLKWWIKGILASICFLAFFIMLFI